MSRILLVVTMLLLIGCLYAQNVVLTETWETGTNGWTILNHNTAPNGWYRGTAASNGGSYSMYVSNTGGSTNNYQGDAGTVAANSAVFFYRDITIPTNVTNIILNFDIRCNGENNYDYVRVYMMPTNVTPVATTSNWTLGGTDPYATHIIGLSNYNQNTLTTPSNGWNNVNISVPNTFAGQSARLVFAWLNDHSVTNQYPGAIDNIALYAISPTDPPLPALLVSPGNGSAFVSTSTTLSWAPNTAGVAPTSYTIYLGTTNPPTGPGDALGNQTSYNPTFPLLNETTYYWRVVPTNVFGSTPVANCPVWSFTTVGYLVSVGNGGYLSQQLPFNPYYRYSYSQTIYYASEISDMVVGSTISGLAYRYNSDSNISLNDMIDVYICHTTRTDFNSASDWVPFSNFTHVYSGPITAPAPTAASPISEAAVQFNIDPFIYEGGNIIVAVTELVYGWTGDGTSTFYHTEYQNQYRSLSFYSDSTVPSTANPPSGTRTTYSPNTTFTYSPPVGNSLVLSPVRISLASINQNTPITRGVSFRSMGEPITISAISCTAGITTTQQVPFTILGGDIVQVTFSIVSNALVSPFTGTITVTSSAVNGPSHILPVVANRVYPQGILQIGDGVDLIDYTLPMYTYYNYTYSQMIYLPSEINLPSGNLIEELHFHYNAGILYDEQIISIWMGYTNQNAFSGASPTNFLPISDFELVYNGLINLNTTEDPLEAEGNWVEITLDESFVYDSTRNLVIAFLENTNPPRYQSGGGFYQMSTPTYRSIRTYNDDWTYDPQEITSNANFDYFQYVPKLRILYGPPIAGAYITRPQSTLNYGDITQNLVAERSVTISSIGTEPVVISSINFPPFMTCSPALPITIPNGSSSAITFILRPLNSGIYSGNIVINSNAVNLPAHSIAVTASVDPDNIIRIGNGSLTDQSLPVEPFYKFTYSQSIYTPADLVDADGVRLEDGSKITHLSWKYNGGSVWTDTIKIYMGHTTQSVFEWDNNTQQPLLSSYIPASELTLVYNGPLAVTSNDGWLPLMELTESITYNSSQNLVIAVNDYIDTAYHGSGDEFYCFSTAGEQSIRMYQDGSTPYNENSLVQSGNFNIHSSVPNITFAFDAPGLPRPRYLVGSAGYGNISLSWDPPNILPSLDIEFVGYKVYRGGFDIISGLQDTEFTDTSIVGGAVYTYYVVAEYNTGGDVFEESAPSNAIEVTAIALNITTHPPTNLVAIGDTGQIPLSWEPGTVVYTESFETTIPTNWLQDEFDGNGVGWEISPTGGFDGDGYVYSSDLDEDGNPTNVSNFLISPIITIASVGTWLNFYIGANDANTTNELFWLRVACPPTDDINQFEALHIETLSDHRWQRRSFDLSAYAGNEIRLLFGHISNPSPLRNRLKIDAVEIVKPNESTVGLPLSYKVFIDNSPLITDWELTYLQLPMLSPGRHEVYVTALYDQLGLLESTPSNLVVIDYVIPDADDDTTIVPLETKLSGNYPNPFNPSTTIAFDMATSGHVTIDVYNIKGQKVISLADGKYDAGKHTVVWNGVDSAGHHVSSGVYFYRMTTSGYSAVKKMLMMK